jgi:hypothetical protein
LREILPPFDADRDREPVLLPLRIEPFIPRLGIARLLVLLPAGS